MPEDVQRANAKRSPPENAIRAFPAQETQRKRTRTPAGETNVGQEGQVASAAREKARAAKASSQAVPEEVARRFVRVGSKYFFPDGARAFTDRGSRLSTPSENTEVIRSLVQIAVARGWQTITVSGTERFRREAWFAATRVNLEVRGYRPTEFEQSRLIRSLSSQAQGSGGDARQIRDAAPESQSRRATGEASRDREPLRNDRLMVGKLIDHGRASYRHDPHEAISYFVKVETARGEREIWGVDLERALRESLTKPHAGDEIGLRAVRREPVTVKARERGGGGEVLRERELATHRNRWIVEKREFFSERAVAADVLRDTAVAPLDAVKKHPELAGTYLQMRAAELAAKQFRDPQDRNAFLSRVREALANAVARGEPLQPVRLKQRIADRTEGERDRAQTPDRNLVRG